MNPPRLLGIVFMHYIRIFIAVGTAGLVSPSGGAQVIIASGGTRGDFTSPDANDGSLLRSEYGFMYRLGAPNGSFGGTAPEPASITLCGIMGVCMAAYGWRRRRDTKPAVPV